MWQHAGGQGARSTIQDRDGSAYHSGSLLACAKEKTHLVLEIVRRQQ